MRRLVLAASAAAVLGAAAVPSFAHGGHDHTPPAPKGTKVACSGNPKAVTLLQYKVGKETAKALYAVPKGKPRGIVVFDHGYGHTMYSWARHITRTAETLGVIAVAPNYRKQVDLPPEKPGGLPRSRGWRVAEGAEDTVVAAKLFEQTCRPTGPNVVYGVSMGGNTSGLAVAAAPKGPDGKPLFDYWVDVEGATNVTETYYGASALAPVNAFAANAKADIEQEMGGTPETARQTYLERTVVFRAADIAASGIKGVVMVHGYVDGLVTHDHSRQLQALLRAQRVPVDFWSAVTRTASSEPGTTIDGYAPTGQTSPFAGHASEASETHVVGKAGFAALAGLYKGVAPTCKETVFDGMTGVTVPGRTC